MCSRAFFLDLDLGFLESLFTVSSNPAEEVESSLLLALEVEGALSWFCVVEA